MGGEPDHPITQDESFPTSPSFSSSSQPGSMIPIEPPPLPRDLKARSFDDENRWAGAYFELRGDYEKSLCDKTPVDVLQDAKNDIRRYKPGDWMRSSGCVPPGEYDIPSTTTLLLVGSRGSGKSSLVNNISRLFEDGLWPDRAQVSYNLSATEGTCFLQEYMIPRQSNSFCLYDTRSLSDDASDNLKLLKRWMTRGVRHGEIVTRNSDSSLTKARIKAKARHGGFAARERRRVDFVIFVVNGISILKSMDNKNKAYINILVETFNYPFLSFRDSKPVIVVTHGDELSFHNRAQVCAYLGELLGVPPTKQIFDIPLTVDSVKGNPNTDLVLVEMLRYSLEQADRNFSLKQDSFHMVEKIVRSMIDELEDSNICIIVLQLFLTWTVIVTSLALLK